MEGAKTHTRPTFKEAFLFWLKLGFISFGGPTGQIAIMHAELVEKRKWISEARFLHALNYCMLLPGPEATQLATYIGWLLHRTTGAVVAGVLFILPSILILWGLSLIYVKFGTIPAVAAIFYGLKPAVLAIVASAMIRIGQRALKNPVMWTIAGLAFVAIFWGKVPFPLIIIIAGLIGLLGQRFWKEKFFPESGRKSGGVDDVSLAGEAGVLEHTRPSSSRAIKVFVVTMTLWWLPVILLGAWLGFEHTLFREGMFFSKAALVTFGGAYAVLPYVSQQAVEEYHWLTAAQMLDGLGLAESTPGPLIMVLQFVGFLGGWNFHAPLSPLTSATLGAFITSWTTFVPSFLFILLGAPYIEQLRDNRKVSAALSSVTAAVVGVILNLAVWFGLHVLFPGTRTIDWFAVAVAVVTFVGITKWKWGVIPVVIGSGLAGWLFSLITKF